MSIVTPDHRRRLEGLQARVREARGRMQSAEQEARQLAENPDVDRDALLLARDTVGSARAEFQRAGDLERQLLSQVAGVVAGGAAGSAESFLDDPNMVQTLEQLAHSSAPIGSMMLGPLCSASDVVDRIRTGQWDSGGRDARSRLDRRHSLLPRR
jgi:hypothetical protein